METVACIKTDPDPDDDQGSVTLSEPVSIVSASLVKSEDIWKNERECEPSDPPTAGSKKCISSAETHKRDTAEQKISIKSKTRPVKQQIKSRTTIVKKSNKVRQKYECLYCNLSFSKLSSLSHHEKVHTGVRQYTCLNCHQRFNTKGERSLHELICKSSSGTTCTSKGKKSSPLIEEGRSVARFKCDKCDKTLVSKQSLEQHTNLHLGIKPYPCRFCHMSFANIGTRWGHEKTVHDTFTEKEEQVKRFPCPYCPQQFAMKGCLNKHIRVHTGEKPYKCQFCDRTFSKGNNRKRHELSHGPSSSSNRELCIFCNTSFYCKSSMKRHVKRVHGIVNALS